MCLCVSDIKPENFLLFREASDSATAGQQRRKKTPQASPSASSSILTTAAAAGSSSQQNHHQLTLKVGRWRDAHADTHPHTWGMGTGVRQGVLMYFVCV